MSDHKMFSLLAILKEVNDREFRKKISVFPEDLRYYATIAGSIIGFENSKRVRETPPGVMERSEEFVSRLLDIVKLDPDDTFREMLETCLIDSLKDELRFCCFNCTRFSGCLELDSLSVGELFRRRTRGEESDSLREEIARQVEAALRKTPYAESDEAYKHCKQFIHQYRTSTVGELFARYTDIAAALRRQFGIKYERILEEIVSINMAFYGKYNEQPFIFHDN